MFACAMLLPRIPCIAFCRGAEVYTRGGGQCKRNRFGSAQRAAFWKRDPTRAGALPHPSHTVLLASSGGYAAQRFVMQYGCHACTHCRLLHAWGQQRPRIARRHSQRAVCTTVPLTVHHYYRPVVIVMHGARVRIPHAARRFLVLCGRCTCGSMSAMSHRGAWLIKWESARR